MRISVIIGSQRSRRKMVSRNAVPAAARRTGNRGKNCACIQAEHSREEERIRLPENHGFVTECTYGCTDQDSDVWIIGCDYYHIGRDEQGRYLLFMTEELRVVCERCIQQALIRPFLYQDGVVWMRNVRLIRNVREAR